LCKNLDNYAELLAKTTPKINGIMLILFV